MRPAAVMIALALLTSAPAPAPAGFSPRLDRLALLADRLDTVPPARFRLDLAGNERPATDPEFIGGAAGWATSIPAFGRDGLKLKIECNPGPDPHGRYFSSHYFRRTTVAYDGQEGPAAVAWFFGLSERDERHLFSALAYPEAGRRDPRAVARRIREFVAREQRKP